MRPARKGPENGGRALSQPLRPLLASMRPARKGPENGLIALARILHEGGFNEAGPQGAGKHTRRNPLRFQVFTAAPRALPHSRQASEPAACRLATGDIVTCSVVKDLPVFEHSPGVPAALERSLRCRGTPQTMTGSRRTAWNFLPRLTTRGSAPSATPTSTSTTWSLA